MSAEKFAIQFRDVFPFGFASSNPNTQQFLKAQTAVQADADAGINQQHGEAMLKMLTGGLGVGAGAMALHHLLRGVKPRAKKETKYLDMTSGAPNVVGEKDAAFDMSPVARALGSLPDYAAKGINGIFSDAGELGGDSTGVKDPQILRSQLAGLMAVGGFGAGAFGGAKLINSIMQRKEKADAAADVEDAKKYYYSVLTGADKRAAAIDNAYAQYEEKRSFEPLDTVQRLYTKSVLYPAAAAALLGGGYMYNRTKEKTRGENLMKAQESRARMQKLPATWVNPEELAHIKRLAEQHA